MLGADHPHVIYARLEWARALIARGRASEAGELLTAVLAHAQTVLEPGHLHLRTARELLAEVCGRAGREAP